MRWKTKIIISIILSFIGIISSFFVKIVPCQISPNIPNFSYSWSLCTLNPDKLSPFGIQELYFGITPQLSDAYIILMGLIFICGLLFLSMFSHKKSKFKNKKSSERGFETY